MIVKGESTDSKRCSISNLDNKVMFKVKVCRRNRNNLFVKVPKMSIGQNANNKPIDYVLVYERIDYEYGDDDDEDEENNENVKMMKEKQRQMFKMAMQAEGLELEEEKIGKYVFIKIHCPFGRLCEEAQTLKMEFPLVGLDWIISEMDEPRESRQSFLGEDKVKKMFGMDEKSSHIVAPFLKDCKDWFITQEQRDTFFTQATRCLLVHNILINIDMGKVANLSNLTFTEKQGLLNMLLKKIYLDAFILHDRSSRESGDEVPVRYDNSIVEMSEDISPPSVPSIIEDTRIVLDGKWTKFFKRQPLPLIRDYFGEKITFYFAWVGTLIISLFIPAVLGVAVFIYGVITRLVNDEEIIFKNGTVIKDDRKGFLYGIDVIKSSSDNIFTPAFAFIICLWGTIFLEVWKRKQATLAHQWHVENFDMAEQERPQYYGTECYQDPFTRQMKEYYPFRRRFLKYLFSSFILVIMVCVVFISVTSVILYRLYTDVNVCKENTKCKMLHGTVIAATLNTISIMILGRIYNFLAVKLTDWENHQTQSAYNDALIIKLFAFQFANTYTSLFYIAFFRKDLGENGMFGMGKEYQDNCGDQDNDNCMSLLSFQLLVLMIMKPVPKFTSDIIIPCLKNAFRSLSGLNQISNSKQHYLMREMLKPTEENFRLDEFTEKVIQYGYIMLFAASFPLAPLLALLFNVVDLRIDAKRLLWWNRRPIPYRDNDIGIWFYIIHFVNILGTISNACLIAFTSKFGRKYSLTQQLIVILIFEHFVFAVKFLLDIAIPDTPESVKLDRKRDRFVVAHFMSVVAGGSGGGGGGGGGGRTDWTKSHLVSKGSRRFKNPPKFNESDTTLRVESSEIDT
ncbi:anoctamin-7-like isoform X1 [Centruroides sculpturatus]|uniref:anoctamin-7-like isoform X1 n=3 Tax=Centruroides sculpturatus TaxID=218467 RepID=UPI000C6CF106|nr:anoctamin-7-like isoform X1 [Centruroides sculpturatus]